MERKTVRAALGDRAYDIVIGPALLEDAGARIAPLLRRPKTVIVSDKTVYAAQGARLEAGLAAANIAFDKILLEPGEGTKTLAQLETLLSGLLDRGVDRSDMIIAFGGGVVGDITGFAAAILRRGCRFVQIPTSLLAQVDSSVGGKTGVNTPQGKNLVGAFYQPSLVLADIDALSTLAPRQMRAGYAEIVKYGALGDAAFFNWLEENGAALLAGEQASLAHAVQRSCEMKAAIVAEDEREEGKRALLNLGHTFGHALEASFGFSDRLLHGEAVAAGMGLAADYSVQMGVCSTAAADRLKAHLRAVGLPAGIEDIPGANSLNGDDLLALMMQDKKVQAGRLALVLMRDIGEAYIVRAVDMTQLKQFLSERTGAAARA
ncbi:MAG: 3-dehydroquinate synthase [Pseudomonadota bacterium]